MAILSPSLELLVVFAAVRFVGRPMRQQCATQGKRIPPQAHLDTCMRLQTEVAGGVGNTGFPRAGHRAPGVACLSICCILLWLPKQFFCLWAKMAQERDGL